MSDGPSSVAYPAHFECDVVLRNGRTVHIRPIRPEDSAGLLELYRGMSHDSLYMRFFGMRTPDAALRDSPTKVDYDSDFGVVGELGGQVSAVAHYFRSKGDRRMAEVAFAIADRAQGCGIGTHLLQTLATIARTHGIEEFQAETLTDNQKMLDVFLCSGFDVKSRSAEGTVRVSFPIAATERYQDRAAERSQKAAWASMNAVFAPRAITVVGANRQRGRIGYEIINNLRQTGFRGELSVVNPRAEEIEGVPAYASVADLPGSVDLAVIAVRAELVESIVDDCIRKGVTAIVVISAGFAETGEAGRELERRLVEKVRAAGIRLVGPNCIGVVNTDPDVRMHATFASIFPPRGNVAMSSQSGALGLAILDYAQSLNTGFSTFISVGNKADVSGNDLIQYWAEDRQTDVMLLYLESFGNPRKFAEIARRVSRRKPIVCVKAGRSSAGARAARVHTGARETRDAIVDDLFKQAGIIRTDTLEESFDVATILANQPLPAGRRVAVVTNAGGPGILAADACEANGLELATLSARTTREFVSFLPVAASVRNPVDMMASATGHDYRRAIHLLLQDPGVDAVIVIYIPVFDIDAEAVSAAIRDSADDARGKTIVATFMSTRGTPAALHPVPSFPFPERAVNALARIHRYAEWRRRPVGVPVRFDDFDLQQLRTIVERKLSAGGGWLDVLDVYAMLVAARIPAALVDWASTAEEAVSAAGRLGYPVVLKAHGPNLVRKSEAGGVKLSLRDQRDVRDAWADLQARLGDRMDGAIVQQMIDDGVELMVAASDEPTFGKVVVYGAGGTLVELLSDVASRIHPLNDLDADDIIEEVRVSRLLHGFRGSKPLDVAMVKEVILRVSWLLEVSPEICDFEINPLKVLEHGGAVVDARVRIEALQPAAPSRRIAY